MWKVLKLISFISIVFMFSILPKDVFSQITIHSSDILGLIGKSQTFENDTTGSITVNVGSPGANQTWDFRSVVVQGIEATQQFLGPQGTPFVTEFPQSNFVMRAISQSTPGFESYTYYEVTSTYFSTLGAGIVTPDTSFLYSFADDIAPLPVQFGSAWTSAETDTFGDPQTGATVTITTSDITVDAWGTVHLPVGNFICLRARSDNTEISQIVVGGVPLYTDTTTNIDYSLLSKDNFVVASVSSQDGETNPNFTNASYFRRLTSAKTDIE
ncbi:MAG: hypothetical protein ACE5OR_17065, partial [bacterium]